MSQLELSVRLLSQQEWAVYGIALLFGLMIGSFVNVVVFGLPKGMPVEAHNGKWPMLGGRSKCPSCGHTIRWYENIPVFSFLWLKGRCSDCRELISPRYPLIEILVATLAVLIVWYFGDSIKHYADS